MKVLLLIPPYIPSYFNAGHHLPVFQVGAYSRATPGLECQVLGWGSAQFRMEGGLRPPHARLRHYRVPQRL